MAKRILLNVVPTTAEALFYVKWLGEMGHNVFNEPEHGFPHLVHYGTKEGFRDAEQFLLDLDLMQTIWENDLDEKATHCWDFSDE